MLQRSARYLFLVAIVFAFSALPARSANNSTVQQDITIFSSAIPIQGALRNGQAVINGSCDLRFSLFTAVQSGERVGPMVTQSLEVSEGLFNTNVDFGDVWNGDPRWLQIEVRCPTGVGEFAVLSPRQAILTTPYAIRSQIAEDALSASATFTANGGLRSSRPGDAMNAGYLELENATNGDKWQLVIRTNPDGQFSFAFYDGAASTWKEQAILSREGSFWARGNITAGGDITTQEGILRSTRKSDVYNGGVLELENATSGNKWQMPIRPIANDSLAFLYWDATQAQWRQVGILDREGQLKIERNQDDDGTLLSLSHPKVEWRFAVDSTGHPEVGIYDVANGTSRWNVLDVDTSTGNIAIKGDARSDEFSLRVYGQTVITTSFPSNTNVLQLQHPQSNLIFHVDVQGHQEIGLYNAATKQTAWDVLDLDPATGHAGFGGTASTTEQMKVYGNFTATGTKAATVDLGDYGQRKFYAVEAADVRFSDEGIATLVDGEVRVILDPVFVAAVEQPYVIHLTPYADAGLYVAEITAQSFLVKAREGDANASFAWRLSAPRRGYADVRLQAVDLPGVGGNEP